MTRKLMMCGNWKMNKNYAEAVSLSQLISNRSYKNWKDVDVVLIPPACDLKGVSNVLEFDHSPMQVGAQNCHWEESGAYTGEVSPLMIRDCGATWCLVGHSERRQMFGETDTTVNLKVKSLLAHGLKPIVCVGETLECREAGEALPFVTSQVRAAFAGVDARHAGEVVVAYEPIWAIGTGRTATPEIAGEMCGAIHECLAEVFGPEAGERVRVLYGGSMKPANVERLLAQETIDGGLIGGASLKDEDFAILVEAALKASTARGANRLKK